MKSFKSFEQLVTEFPKLSTYVSNHLDYLAHTSNRSDKSNEKLQEHIDKVNEYALKLCHAHSLDEVVDRLLKSLILDNQNCIHAEAVGNYMKSLFIRSIIFHDYGKVNPNFQTERMKNQLFIWDKGIKIESQHSKLSAFIFIHHHLKEIHENTIFTELEKAFLWTCSFLLANPILKHHASYIEHEINFSNDVFKSLQKFLSQFNSEFETSWEYFVGLEKNNSDSGLLDFFERFLKGKGYFAIIAFIKLNFSLLTAADYYATNSYYTGMEIDDFGLISGDLKNRIIGNFKTFKNYNKDLFENFAYYSELPFSQLQEKSNNNLNLLRQKLTAQVIIETRGNLNSRLFYLEAPTGAGKTNLSLAIATELMNVEKSLDKIFYVFPFNTLITQTFQSVKETLGLSNNEVVQLHSKSGFHEREVSEEKDALYGKDKLNFIDNLFINYPITLFSHIKFFDILKSNSKETNYLLHRLTNAIIIIDELQSYNPKHWDKVVFFLSNYAQFFNLKIILMSATLPKINELDKAIQGNITQLITNKNEYFLNPNFRDRIEFDFSLLSWKKEREPYLNDLRDFVLIKSEERSARQNGNAKVIIEFIKKKSAGEFYSLIEKDTRFNDYTKFLISGEILEPQRKYILDSIKSQQINKILLVSTQVIESGVDIDMDLGFKDKSLIDSDEQLAGRVNRNASKSDCKVYIFNLDKEADVYRKDSRYKITQKQIDIDEYQEILQTKDFDKLYKLVMAKIKGDNENEYLIENLPDYLSHFKNLNFTRIHREFQLIDEDNTSVFVPLPIPSNHFSKEDMNTMKVFLIEANIDGCINGEDIWKAYLNLIGNKIDFVSKQIELKKISGVMSKFMFSVYQRQLKELKEFCDIPISEKIGIWYLSRWSKIYSYEGGLKSELIKADIFL